MFAAVVCKTKYCEGKQIECVMTANSCVVFFIGQRDWHVKL